MVAKRGVVNLFGGLPKTAPAISVLSNHLHYREAYVTGSHGSTPRQHQTALRLIEEGTVVEEGTHAELMAKAGAYRKLVDLQLS